MHRLNPPNATPARFSATTVIACVALALSGCAVGILLGRWTAAPSPVSEHNIEMPALQADIANALNGFQASAEGVLQAIRAREAAPQSAPGQRESAAPSPENLDRLTAAIERLDALIQANSRHVGGGSPAVEKSKGPGFPSLEALWQRVHEIMQTDDPKRLDTLVTEMCRVHLAWTREDLFQRYGAPQALSGKDRDFDLTYKRGGGEQAMEAFTFKVADDVVVFFYY